MNLLLTVPSRAVEEALARYPGNTDDAPEAVDVARRHPALPLYNDFMGCFALRPSGECVFIAWDDPASATPIALGLPDFRVIHVARVRGGLRYPEIPGIMPERPTDATACPSCHGSGQAVRPEVVCECGGLGWVAWAPDGAA